MKTEQELDLSGLRELLAKATPGHWGVEDPMDHCLAIVANPADPVYDWIWVASCDWPDEDEHNITSTQVKANAALIVAAVNALPALLSRTQQAEAERDAAVDLLADRSTELDNERQARQAAEASVKELEEEIERRAAQEEMDDSLRDGCMDSLLAAESSLKERNEEVARLREERERLRAYQTEHGTVGAIEDFRAWCCRAAEREGDGEIGAGPLAADPFNPLPALPQVKEQGHG